MSAVWYVGPASRRLFTAADWARHGISADDVEWNVHNGWSLPTTTFTTAQLAVLDDEAYFVLGAPDGPRDGAVIPDPGTGGGVGDPSSSTIKVISEIPGLTLRFGPGPLPADPSTMPKTVYIVVPT
jgi:hypothetical protein